MTKANPSEADALIRQLNKQLRIAQRLLEEEQKARLRAVARTDYIRRMMQLMDQDSERSRAAMKRSTALLESVRAAVLHPEAEAKPAATLARLRELLA